MALYIDPHWHNFAKKCCKKRKNNRMKRLQCNNFSIIANTCIGGVICGELCRPFLSPTVNIYIRPKDFVRFCKNIRHYLAVPIEDLAYDPKIGYPVATLAGEVTLYGKHYHDFDEMRESWNRRKERIDWNHICFMMTDRDFVPPFSLDQAAEFCGEDVLQAFDALPWSHKVCFVKDRQFAKRYPSCVQVSKCCDKRSVGVITEFATITGKHLYECAKGWDYLSFLNGLAD